MIKCSMYVILLGSMQERMLKDETKRNEEREREREREREQKVRNKSFKIVPQRIPFKDSPAECVFKSLFSLCPPVWLSLPLTYILHIVKTLSNH